ncbi:hypothetical protein N7493_000930 [Penicillium malachiteum]|uniref:Cytochrome P450 n=1 Tax=Penicillium malachiteum TaxID=1324776 RepID=A0AAD6N184_9EURO|nr:hypothetical protein N7493_000930 [Penicillium malachiteum]
MFNVRPHKEHAALRRHIAGPYKFSNFKKLEPLMDHRMREWFKRLDEKFAETGDAFDFSWWSLYLAYDVISEAVYGAPFGFIEQGKDIKITPLKKYLVVKSTDDSGMGVLLRFRDNLIDKRLEDMKMGKHIDKVDFLVFTKLCGSAHLGPPFSFDMSLHQVPISTGRLFPPGIEVAVNAWILHRDPALYGEDTEVFCPDCWLNPERAKMFKRYDFTFGYGSRACLGKDIATMKLFKAPLQFLRRYQFERVPGKPEPRFVLHGGIASWIDVWITLRQKSSVK